MDYRIMVLNIGIALGNLNDSGAPWQYFSTLTEKLAVRSEINVYGLYTGGNRNNISESVTLTDVSSTNPLPTWHRVSEKYELDLFHVNVMPKFGHWPAFKSKIPVVVTSHAAPHWRDLPLHTRPSLRFNLEYQIRDIIGRHTIDTVFTVCESVRQAYIESAGYQPSDVITTYEGVDDIFFEKPRRPHPTNFPDEYLLHVSKAQDRKNVSTILNSIELLADSNPDFPPLIITGKGWEEKLSKTVEEDGMKDQVNFTGYVSQDRLIQLYDNAEIFIFPSFREGFGLPNVEAMARGTPVITSDKFAIPEIVDGGGILLDDPLDERELADAINRLLSDGELRDELISKGQSRSKKFTWRNHTDQIIKAYKTVSKNN